MKVVRLGQANLHLLPIENGIVFLEEGLSQDNCLVIRRVGDFHNVHSAVVLLHFGDRVLIDILDHIVIGLEDVCLRIYHKLKVGKVVNIGTVGIQLNFGKETSHHPVIPSYDGSA